MPKYLTPEGLEKLKKELDYLKNVKRKEIAERLKKTAAMGDLSENAAYHEAKEAQGFLEGKILELEKEIKEAKIVEKNGTGWIQIGSLVTLISNGKKEKFQIVGTAEVDPLNGKISLESPLGKALLDKPEGVVVTVKTPNGKLRYKIVKIE
jgi:transcription elongation factor GreA